MYISCGNSNSQVPQMLSWDLLDYALWTDSLFDCVSDKLNVLLFQYLLFQN